MEFEDNRLVTFRRFLLQCAKSLFDRVRPQGRRQKNQGIKGLPLAFMTSDKPTVTIDLSKTVGPDMLEFRVSRTQHGDVW
jgi:hypothetical protein